MRIDAASLNFHDLDVVTGRPGAIKAMGLERGRGPTTLSVMTQRSPFRYVRTSAEIIRLVVMLHGRFPLSLRTVDDLLPERGIKISHGSVRFRRQRCPFRRSRGGHVHGHAHDLDAGQ